MFKNHIYSLITIIGGGIKRLRIKIYQLKEDFKHQLNIERMRKKDVIISNIGCYLTKCKFEGKNIIGDKTKLNEVSLGYGSYIGSQCDIKRTIIGKYRKKQ